MKQLVYTAILCMSFFGMAQSTYLENTISVYGVSDITTGTKTYKTDVTLSLDDNYYYSDNPCTSLDELKDKYFAEVKKQGIDISKYKEDELRYLTMGYRKNGLVYTFTTKNKDEIVKVFKIKIGQVKASYIQVKNELNDAEINKIVKMALENGKESAEIVAKAAGKKLGAIHSIGSYDLGKRGGWQSLNTSSMQLRLNIVYKIKE